MYMAKTRMLISCAITVQLICTIILCICKKRRFSLDSAHLYGINEQSQEKTCLFAYAQNNIKQYKLYLRYMYNDLKWHMLHNIE